MLDHIQFVDQIIAKLSMIADSKGLDRSIHLVDAGRMLVTLQKGIRESSESMKKEIERLRKENEDLIKLLNNGEPVERMRINTAPIVTRSEDQNEH